VTEASEGSLPKATQRTKPTSLSGLFRSGFGADAEFVPRDPIDGFDFVAVHAQTAGWSPKRKPPSNRPKPSYSFHSPFNWDDAHAAFTARGESLRGWDFPRVIVKMSNTM